MSEVEGFTSCYGLLLGSFFSKGYNASLARPARAGSTARCLAAPVACYLAA